MMITTVALAAALAASAAAGEPPRLVVLVAVDQLPRTRLTAALPGGLGRLLREGRVFVDATLAHAVTVTCPGHATMLTGTNPGPAGIPANELFDREGKPTYCVADLPEGRDREALGAAYQRAGVVGAPPPRDAREAAAVLRSPARLRVDALGDWLGAGAKVFSVSAKDRAAIMLGGKRPTLAVWLEAEVGFTTSRYYAGRLPPWLARFDADHGFVPFRPERFPRAWSYAGDDPAALPDDDPSEVDRYGRTSPHPLRAETLAGTVARLRFTPYVDELTLDLARVIVRDEQLGTGPRPSLLAVSLSGTDYIGHAYGPDSQEAAQALRTLDAQLDAFLADLEARVPRERLLVVLTSDHGVSRTPEVATRLDASECGVAGGRVSGADWIRRVERAAAEVCEVGARGLVAWDHDYAFKLAPGAWAAMSARCGASRERLLAGIAAKLARAPGVVRIWTPADVGADVAPCAGFCRLYRSSFDGERSGDLLVQLDPTCQLTDATGGAGHGSPYAYDRAVPLVFWGNGIPAGPARGRAHTIDIAPTLASRLGIAPPTPRDGVVLPLQ